PAVAGIGVSVGYVGPGRAVSENRVVGDLCVALVDLHGAAVEVRGVPVHQVVADTQGVAPFDRSAGEQRAVADDDVAPGDGPRVAVDVDGASHADLPLREIVGNQVPLDDDGGVHLGARTENVDAAAEPVGIGGPVDGRGVHDVLRDGVPA